MEDDSGYGSGCQSGWSLYLGPSSVHPKSNDNEEEEGEGEKVDGEEDEGISTVSDASSGPHKFHEAAQKDSGKRRRTEMNNPARGKVSASSLEDTASSPFLNFSDTGNFNISHDTAGSACSDVEVCSEFSATYQKGWSE